MINKGFPAFEIFVVALLVCGGYGWVNNIIILYHGGITPLTGQIICRAAGVFVAPLGMVMGYL